MRNVIRVEIKAFLIKFVMTLKAWMRNSWIKLISVINFANKIKTFCNFSIICPLVLFDEHFKIKNVKMLWRMSKIESWQWSPVKKVCFQIAYSLEKMPRHRKRFLFPDFLPTSTTPIMKILKQMISLVLLTLIGEVMKSSLVADALQTQHMQNSVVSCEDGKRKLLCLPQEYSKFDLPHRNDFNEIEIGKYHSPSFLN